MNNKQLIALLLKISVGLLGIMLFVRLEPIYQMIPIILLLLIALVLAIIVKAKKENKQYKKFKKH